MYISQTSWHFKLYTFTKMFVERFRGNPYWDSDSIGKSINLCPYMRTILIWGPIVLSFYALLYAFGFYVLIYMPITVTNGAALINIGMFIAAGLGICIALIAFFIGAGKLTETAIIKRRERLEELKNAGVKPSGFFVILGEYARSLKSKTCIKLEVK